MRNDLVLVLVVITALAFDFTNGFHDTGNAMATSIATGALPPRVAVALSGLLNLVGAFLSLAVAATIANGLVNTADVTLQVVAAGLAGGIIWNLLTWLFGIPSSSSHALIGGVIGSTLAAAGGSAVKWQGLVSKVIIPAAMSPIIAALVAAVGTWLLYRISRSLTRGARNHGFRIGQVGSACMVSLAHGTNDAQKTMGVITLALIANGTLATGATAPFWVILSCAVAISLGIYLGGWRVIRTLGKGPGRDRVAAGHGGRVLVGRDHLAVGQLRLLAVDHARRHWLDHRHRARQEGRGRPLDRGRADGYRVAVHPPVSRDRGRPGVLARPRDRRQLGRDHPPGHPDWPLRGHLPEIARHQGGPQQRERRMDRGRRPVRTRARGRGLRDRKAQMSWINLSALWKILVFGLLAGAGLPALFAIGLRALVMPGSRVQTAGADSDHVYGGNVLGLVIAAICFLIILAALGWGIYEVYQIGHPAPAKH